MEAVDILYLVMKDLFDGVDFGKSIKVDYIYNHKTVDVGYADWVLLYNVVDDTNWLGIDTCLYEMKSVVAVDVRTANRQRYGKIKQYILTNFKSDKYVFQDSGEITEFNQNIDFGHYTEVGTYVTKAELYNPDNVQLERGSRVRLNLEDGTIVDGWYWGIYDNEMYVFRRPGVFWVVVPTRFTELSDKMKGLYRFVMDVQVRIFER